MSPRRGAWMLAALASLALVAFLHHAAASRQRAELIAELARHPYTQDQAGRVAIERLAAEVFEREVQRPDLDQRLLGAAFAVLRRDGGDAAERVRLRAIAELERELARALPDAQRLRLHCDLLEFAGAAELAGFRERIAALSGDHRAAAERLAALAARVRDAAGGDAGDAALAELVAERRRLERALNWAARESAPMTGALSASALAAQGHVESLLEPLRAAAEGAPAGYDERIAAAAAAQPERIARLRRTWALLDAGGLGGRGDQATVACYAAAVRWRHLPASGLLLGLAVAGLLFGGMALAMRRVARGPLPIDPSAETLENVEPIDLDTDAETQERRQHTGSGHDTTLG